MRILKWRLTYIDNAAAIFKVDTKTGTDGDHLFIFQAERRRLNITTWADDGSPNKPRRVRWTRYGSSFEEALQRMHTSHHRVVEHLPADFNNYFVTIEPDFRALTDSGMRTASSADQYNLKAGTYHRSNYGRELPAPAETTSDDPITIIDEIA
ncbi:hypothetical protein CSIM01_10776 [Colletotrichum simmondsii]|uniref:Uncharacterized protein n=1 Tax=Colletotrichum simmondsii TaxID=703756 RepID=A0A135SVS2_9PEZI|nr:hypothetical protein CSIM01_10776 [Colletotrichum simmondsii]